MVTESLPGEDLPGVVKPGQLGRDLTQALALSFGFSILCLLAEVSLPLDPGHLNVYHFGGAASVLFVPILIDIAVVWLLCAGLMTLARRGRSRVVVWSIILLTIPWIALKDWSVLLHHQVPHLLSLSIFILTLLASTMAIVSWRPSREAAFERLFKPGRTVLGFLSLSGSIIFAELLFSFWAARGLNAPGTARDFLHPVITSVRSPAAPARIIVIVFDELSYDQVFADRSPRLHLSAFDAFAAQSTNFEDARPAGRFTDVAMPALLTGLPLSAVKSSPDGRTLNLQDAHGWTRLDPANTLFSDAQRSGYRTSVAGWHIPYCRILGSVLDRCEWHSEFSGTWLTENDHSISANVFAPLHLLLQSTPGFLSLRGADQHHSSNLDRHTRDFQQIVFCADQQLSDPALGFVLLHLPIPHQGAVSSPNMVNARSGTSSYLNNLSLADAYLAHARRLLEDRGQWESSAIVVMGDHSWRTWLWATSPEWTPEDTSRGAKFDDRPALLLKLPNQQVGQRIATAFDPTRFRPMLDAIMNGQLEDPTHLKTWVN